MMQDYEVLVKRQIQNEQEIIDKGIEKYRNALMAAEQDGTLADTLPGRWLTSNFIEDIAVKIRGFIYENLDGKPGVRAKGADLLNILPADACAFIALRTIMNSLITGKGDCSRATLNSRICRELAEEIQYNHMEIENTPAFRYWMREIQTNPNPRTKYRCKMRLKKNYTDLPKFKKGEGGDEIAAAAEVLIRFTVEATNIATFEMKRKRGEPHKLVEYLYLNPEFNAKLEKAKSKAETMWPKYEPMLCPPRPWTGAYQGGFIGKLGKRTKLVRSTRRSYLEDIHSNIQSMDKVLKAVNAVQATPWRINKAVFNVMSQAFASRHSSNYALPEAESLPDPVRPADIKTNIQASKDFVDNLKAIQRLEAARASKYRATKLVLDTAEKYLHEEAIYFAHNLDWRGRLYPMSSYLSPQGKETHRALLEFANGLPLETDEAVEWLAIHGAGCFGYDKVTFADRVKWVHENEQNIRDSARAPLDFGWWVKADKPWMFLAWCFDWVGYLESGKAHVSHLPVAMDGSCNGLQNFAAMLRHEETARAVNLMPSEVPNDIYQQVADKVIPMVEALAMRDSRDDDAILAEAKTRTDLEYDDKKRVSKAKAHIKKQVRKKQITEKEGRALSRGIKLEIGKEERARTNELWGVLSARWIKDHITRKLVKRPVMTYPYSVTVYGMRDQLVETLLEMYDKGETDYPIKHRGKVADMLKFAIYEAIRETVVAAARAMEWLRDAAKVVAEGNLPVQWVSPIGMRVLQNYWESTSHQISIRSKNSGVTYRPKIYAELEKVVKASKQASGVAPNFVHSCDASHLMFTVNACQDAGITDFHMIHDSYGTHARNAALLARTLREEFVKMYSDHDVLADFHRQLQEQVADKPELAGQIPQPPQAEGFDLNQVLQSRYFFA